ncbi:hypothetical protein FE782_10360 [Paenibacillus antri]|uniref:Uncharacterized protein n=1 Tax=Paenibacillus antri TaxID=2582848 RepID=A0A5R9GDF3_9BACL|nr:hypothetical protein [Paenibacillus antri]TLS52366.1 hypothetical protein FE782_10360 [Paenibacillus antri]
MQGPNWLYEKAFDWNDWFVLGCIAFLYSAVYLMPKRLSKSTMLLIFLFSATFASILDNSIGGHIFDLYDIMDGPAYTVMDFTLYFLYAPFGYFFVYFYDLFRVRGLLRVGYVVLWSGFSVAFELLCSLVGVFHYKDAYGLHYSFSIYLFVQSATIMFYHYITDRPLGTSP